MLKVRVFQVFKIILKSKKKSNTLYIFV